MAAWPGGQTAGLVVCRHAADRPATVGTDSAASTPMRPSDGGWDLNNDAPDIYVFVPGGDYRRLRSDFLKLTGPTEMPPLFALGAFDSRWFDYSEATALKQIDDYRAHRIPLDVLVVDTGWRRNASTGYQPNTNLFPERGAVFPGSPRETRPDHVQRPSRTAQHNVPALDPKELNYRLTACRLLERRPRFLVVRPQLEGASGAARPPT